MSDQKFIYLGKGEGHQFILGEYANRHGLVAGATGTGKTVTLQVLAEGFAEMGVPCFMADIKGDLSGVAFGGQASARVMERAAATDIQNWQPSQYTAVFWDVFGKQGHPVRATLSEMGPLLLARLLELNDTQEGVLQILWKYADDNGLLLLDLKDLRALLAWASENNAQLSGQYGQVSKQTIGIIQRNLLMLEQQGGEAFFGEPALDIAQLIQVDSNNCGVLNILAANELIHRPRLYSTFLLWMLSELFENLPERGDADKPLMVFFFDEAHLLFNDAPKALLTKIEQVVRLIRSKGVGIYFVTQNPLDIPDTVLGQLGNRVQHALRAFTPRDQKAVKTAADTFRANPNLNTADAITQLGVGEALVSTLGKGGIPSVVDRILIRPPRGQIGAITPEQRQEILANSPFAGQYEQMIDRESAYEMLAARAEQTQAEAAELAQQKAAAKRPAARQSDSVWEAAAKSATRSVASEVGRSLGKQILRGLLGGFGRR